MSNIHPSLIADSMEMEADGYVDLFKIELRPSGTLYLKDNNEVTWQGNTYQPIAIALSAEGNSADGEKHRPSLRVVNPEGMFSKLIADGNLDKARVTRYRVLRSHVEQDQNISIQNLWVVSRVVSLNKIMAVFELRAATDGQFFSLPLRKFIPPDFPQVTLG